MKKNIYIIAVFSFFVFHANAQENNITINNSENIRVGIKAGVNIANFVGDDAGDAKNFIGFNGGLFFELKVTNKFHIQPEFLYSTQGSKSDLFFEGSNLDITFKTKYINIPVMAKLYVANDFQLEVGPYVGFLIDADVIGKYQGQTETIDGKDFLKSNDYGINLGFNYDFSDVVFFNARYAAGLMQIGDTGIDDDIKNSVFQFGLGFKL